jgi:hypothetical protein
VGIFRDGAWHISYGFQDLAVRIVSFRAEDSEAALVPVGSA